MGRNDLLEMGELTDTSYYILLSLIEEKHGYLIMKTIEDLTDGSFSIGPASLYTSIKKLLSAVLIELVDTENKNRKTYITTKKGIEFLKKEIQRRRKMIIIAEKIFEEKGDILK
jgi:DNA-binding PadR family transcriptional regulator